MNDSVLMHIDHSSLSSGARGIAESGIELSYILAYFIISLCLYGNLSHQSNLWWVDYIHSPLERHR